MNVKNDLKLHIIGKVIKSITTTNVCTHT